MRHEEDEGGSGSLSRRQLLRRGVLAGSVMWSAPVVESIFAPAFGRNATDVEAWARPAEPTASSPGAATGTAHGTSGPCGRMSGGGTVAGGTRFLFELHCRPVESDFLTVTFKDPDRRPLTFHLDRVTRVNCSDQAGMDPTPPGADFDTMEGFGVGHITGPGAPCGARDSATIAFRFADAGEPSWNDVVHLFVTCGNTVLLNVTGPPLTGDVQAHDDPSRC